MDAQAIDHVYVETADYDAARRFWLALGYEPESEWGEGGHRAGKFMNGTAAVVLATADAGATPVGPTVHFRVPDTGAAQRELAGSDDVRIVLPEQPTHWGTRWMRVADPDGHTWVLEQTST